MSIAALWLTSMQRHACMHGCWPGRAWWPCSPGAYRPRIDALAKVCMAACKGMAAHLVGCDERVRLVHTDLGLTHLHRYVWLTWSGVTLFVWCTQMARSLVNLPASIVSTTAASKSWVLHRCSVPCVIACLLKSSYKVLFTLECSNKSLGCIVQRASLTSTLFNVKTTECSNHETWFIWLHWCTKPQRGSNIHQTFVG